jgi:hypothetical protein
VLGAADRQGAKVRLRSTGQRGSRQRLP